MKYKKGDLLSYTDSQLYIIKHIPNMMEISDKLAKGEGYMCVELFELGRDDYTLQIIPISAGWIDKQGFRIDDGKVNFMRECVTQAFEGNVYINK